MVSIIEVDPKLVRDFCGRVPDALMGMSHARPFRGFRLEVGYGGSSGSPHATGGETALKKSRICSPA